MPTDICFRVRQIPLELTLESLSQAIEECFPEDEGVSARVDRERTTLVPCCYNPKTTQTSILHFDSEPPRALVRSLGTNATYGLEISSGHEILIDKEFYGLTQLYAPSMDIKLDIIALSGLNGHTYGSWASKGTCNNRGRRKMWLRHFFQKDRRECRTMIYGYNSRLNEPGIHTLSDYSGAFLEEIYKVRKGNEDRPVALIGHSFGGIIIADAIVKDKENPRDGGCLFKMTKAIFFFATPHRGIVFDDLLEMVGEGSPRLDLVHSIRRGQEEKNLQLFIRYVEEEYFRIVSIQETMQTRKLKQNPATKKWARTGPYYTPLEKESSILNLPRDFEETLSAEGDHSTLVKFSHSQESIYTTLVKRFENLLDHVTQASSRNQVEINSRLRVAISEQEYSLVSVLLTLGKANPDAEDHECYSEIIKQVPPVRSTKDSRILKLLSLYDSNKFENTRPGYTSFIKGRGEHNGPLQAGRKRDAEEIGMSQSKARCDGMDHNRADNTPEAHRKEVLAWLSSLEPENDYERIYKKRHGDTGRWFLESNEVRKWLKEGEMSLLWCYGSPGVGKSVLTSTLLESITTKYRDDKAVGIAYFYFSFQATTRQEPVDVLRIWIKQLCRQLKEHPQSLLDLHKQCTNDDIKPRFSELERLIQEVINRFKEVFVIIDALDECSKENRKALVNHLVQVSKHSSCVIKFFIASRREVDIERILLSASFSTFPVLVTKVDEDIATYITHELKNREQELFELDGALKEAIQTKLLEQSNGMFLWVKCQLDYIYEQPSKKDIIEALDSLPDTIVDTYDRVLTKINNQPKPMRELAHRVLCWVITAKRPLSAKELATAVAIEPTAMSAGLEEIEGKYREETVLASCCGFVTNECGTVRPIHFSVQEFLKDKLQRIYEGIAGNTFVTNSLLKYLLVTDFEYKVLEDRFRPTVTLSSKLQNLLEYSCIYVNLHLNDLNPLPICVLGLAKELLEEKQGILRWVILEVFRSQGKKSIVNVLAGVGSEITLNLRYINYKRLNTKVTPLLLLSSLNLLSLYFHLYAKSDKTQLEQVLHQVVRNGSVSAVKGLLNHGCDIEFQDAGGNTPLLTAVRNGCEEVAVFLIAKGADIHRFDNSGAPALHYACKGGMINMAKTLINNGANPNNCKVLETAIERGSTEIVKLLLEAGADVNIQCGEYGTALQAAIAKQCSIEIIKALLEAGADVNIQDGIYDIPLQTAIVEGHSIDIINALLEAGADVNIQDGIYGTALQAAIARNNSVEIIKALLEAGADVNIQDWIYGTALRIAIVEGHSIEIIKALLEAGADANIQDGIYGTALHEAIAKTCSVEIIKALLEAGADVNIQGGIYGTALHAEIAERCSVEIIKALLEAGADVNSQGNLYLGTALQFAAFNGSAEIVKVLIEAGANVNVEGGSYGNALQAAANSYYRREKEEIVEILLEAGAIDVNESY